MLMVVALWQSPAQAAVVINEALRQHAEWIKRGLEISVAINISAKNLQDWRFVVVTDKEIRHKLAHTTNRPESFNNAGVLIAGCSNSDDVMTCGQPIAQIDVAIALEHISLQATELGLGSCWIGSFKTDQVRQILGIPDEIAIIELMALGYPADTWKKPNRQAIQNVVCFEKWNF